MTNCKSENLKQKILYIESIEIHIKSVETFDSQLYNIDEKRWGTELISNLSNACYVSSAFDGIVQGY